MTGPSQAAAPTSAPANGANSTGAQKKPNSRKRKGHRAGKKKRSRRKSFALLHEDSHDEVDRDPGEGFYKQPAANLSGTSIDSEALLDHRAQQPMRLRRASTVAGHSPFQNPFQSIGSRLRSVATPSKGSGNSGPSTPWDETAPLLSTSVHRPGSHGGRTAGSYGTPEARSARARSRRNSSLSSRPKLRTAASARETYDVNNPPSRPASPTFGSLDINEPAFADVMIHGDLDLRNASPRRLRDGDGLFSHSHEGSEDNRQSYDRRSSGDVDDVCYPGPGMSELGDDEQPPDQNQYKPRRRRHRWPDLSVLEEWMHFEKEDRSEERRVKKITEPQLINGRLRPVRKGWYQTDEDAPYRFTYFNEEFQSTIHSQTISELVQPGSNFRELFVPDPRVLSDDESDNEDDEEVVSNTNKPLSSIISESRQPTRQPSLTEAKRDGTMSPSQLLASALPSSRAPSVREAPSQNLRSMESSMFKSAHTDLTEKPVRYGDRPVWWLDIMCPTEEEMKVIAKAFGIHPLTAEDIMVQEAREKVELFRHYYFVNYRTFDQDINSDNYLEPVNMYVVVFREGVLSFHFSMTPHAANVRRRIRQLRDYLILSSDWISYAIIDDITDVFQPLIQNIEDEVDDIDEAILQLHSTSGEKDDPKGKGDDASSIADSSGDMLRRVGECRKRVMSLYRLLGNKADVIKGFAKRCNERWEVAPRSEIGLYLGDIQDHIITMTSNLGHYEKILARAHGNYLAQINILMNERQELTANVLGRLSVIGTIVLPMNIITGLWGMNVWVPGQQAEGDLQWFMWISAGLLFFGLACYMIAKRVYNIV